MTLREKLTIVLDNCDKEGAIVADLFPNFTDLVKVCDERSASSVYEDTELLGGFGCGATRIEQFEAALDEAVETIQEGWYVEIKKKKKGVKIFTDQDGRKYECREVT